MPIPLNRPAYPTYPACLTLCARWVMSRCLRASRQRQRQHDRLFIAQYGDLDGLSYLRVKDQVAVQILKPTDRLAIDVDDQIAAPPLARLRPDKARSVGWTARRRADHIGPSGL